MKAPLIRITCGASMHTDPPTRRRHGHTPRRRIESDRLAYIEGVTFSTVKTF